MSDLVLRDVEVDGRRADVRVVGGVVDQVVERADDRPALPAWVIEAGVTDGEMIEGGGGALLPGLWDHHTHLLAAGAARRSVAVGPEHVDGLPGLGRVLGSAPPTPSGWIRAVGYHESAAGELDRTLLDRLGLGRPVRVQHRSGALWVLDSTGIERARLDDVHDERVERGDDGRPTGRVFGGDELLRDRVTSDPPDLRGVGEALASSGVVGVLDATPCSDVGGWRLLADARAGTDLPQHVWVTGAADLADVTPPPPLRRGPVKIYLADHALADLDAVSRSVAMARAAGRAVAFHSVTAASLVLALAALDDHPPHPGDRIEHGAVIPDALVPTLADRHLTVVTQPGFVAERGDRYRVEVDPGELPFLYRCRSLIEAGVRVAGSTDLPFTDPDPWKAIAAATTRRAPDGRALGAAETVDPRTALGLFLGPVDDPGGPPRTIESGAPADLCLLDRPLDEQLPDPTSDAVVATIIGGVVVHRR